MLGDAAVQQGSLGVARIVKPGFGARLRTRVRARVLLNWTCGGRHGVPAWAGCRWYCGYIQLCAFFGAVRG